MTLRFAETCLVHSETHGTEVKSVTQIKLVQVYTEIGMISLVHQSEQRVNQQASYSKCHGKKPLTVEARSCYPLIYLQSFLQQRDTVAGMSHCPVNEELHCERHTDCSAAF